MDNLLKSTSEDPLDQLIMMMQMDNFPSNSVHTPLQPPPSPPPPPATPNFSFHAAAGPVKEEDKKPNSLSEMREMMFRIAVMQPIVIDHDSIKAPKRKNVRISKDPQSVAARHRRERISEKIRILQRIVPGGTKMDTASMLDEAILYVKFMKTQVQLLEKRFD